MFIDALKLQKTKKLIVQGILFFLVFMLIYFIVDTLNMSYAEMQALNFSKRKNSTKEF